MSFLFVGLGGALGAICRYSLSLITIKVDFPLMTFITNFAGAIFIGLIVGFASKNKNVSPNMVLFLKTGFCGGFTTFSTFSLETWNLFQAQKYAMAGVYAGVSLILCIVGVGIGMWISNH